MGKVWECKIGEPGDEELPPGADGPMRSAVEQAYQELVGRPADFAFSGWGGRLTEVQRAVHEDRAPDFSLYDVVGKPVTRTVHGAGQRLMLHEPCGTTRWVPDAERVALAGEYRGEEAPADTYPPCPTCGVINPLDWELLYLDAAI